jgi:cold shock CspA family protein
MLGRIVSISPERGLGVIAPAEEGGELTFQREVLHGTSLEELSPGLEVEFLLGQEAGDRPSAGLRVVDVRLVEPDVPPDALEVSSGSGQE